MDAKNLNNSNFNFTDPSQTAQNIANSFVKPGQVGFGDKLSDIFLGTNKQDQLNQQAANQNNLIAQLGVMNEQNRFNEFMSNNAMSFSKDQSETAMKFQKYMSDTAYQRSIKDMVAAGINPSILFNTSGASAKASSPSGSSSSGVSSSSGSGGSAAHFNYSSNNFKNGLLGNFTGQFVSNVLSNFLPDSKHQRQQKLMSVLKAVL